MKVYVNLHPKGNLSSVIISERYIGELKEYIKCVDWLRWDFVSRRGKKIIKVHHEEHNTRTYVVLQRLMDKGADVFIRNERDDEWRKYQPKQVFSKDEMIKIEQQRDSVFYELEWAKKDLEKVDNLIEQNMERGILPDDFLLKWQEESRERVEKAENQERIRCEAIATLWD